VVTLYSVEESEGIHFLTMELVEGPSLDRLIPGNGLPVDRIVEIAGALAEALAAAHEKGILHRDLKPANVMVTNEGRVKVLDFGLAKDVGAESSDGATLSSAGRTQAGVVMGTPAYMSPEQVSGRALDHRSDIFSLGVVLHEMATGRRPFDGVSSAELISSILRDTPVPVTEQRPDLPSDLARVIRRCLEKDPRYRVQTARDVGNEFRDLARLVSGPSAAGTSSSQAVAKPDTGATRADEGFWVAVLPFRAPGGDADLEALADGLTEDVTSGLSRFPYLRVIAHNSAMAFRGRAADIRTVGCELGARYVLEGSVRKRGRAVRVSAQLLDAASGTQLWAEAYDREISNTSPFEIQDDLTDHIVTTVADGYGVLVRSMATPTRDKNVEDLSASELVLRYYAFMQQVDPQEHAVLRAGLERALEREPNHATAWACLSAVYLWEYLDRWNPREKPMERARDAAWRSVKIDSACQMGWKQLAEVYFFSRDYSAFRETAERAMSLNPRDGITSALMAIMIAYSGDWERGAALAQRTMELNRHHPGWYHLTVVHHQYRKGEYEAALQTAKKINMPEFHWAQLMIAAACGMLGRREEAHTAIELLRKYNATFLDLNNVREDIEKWAADKDVVEQLLQGLQKAGLTFGPSGSAAREAVLDPKGEGSRAPAPASDSISGPKLGMDSGQVRADEGFWVAVLPFKYTSSNADLKALAEGVSEEVVTGLSRFSYLRVIARGSTAKYSSQSGDVRAIGKELGARYVMEGSLRQAGAKVRVSVQLVDATSGAHLWADTYDRTFNPETAFELQDDLVPRIVSTVADWYGVLPHSMSEAVRAKGSEQLSPYEAVLRSFGYYERVNAEEHAVARAGLERAVQQAPENADGWVMLSMMYGEEFRFGFNVRPDPMGRSLQAAQRAVDAGPSNPSAYLALAQALFFRKEFGAFRSAAERAIALNPMDGATLGYLSLLVAFAGDWERGCALGERARELNPHHPAWYWALPLLDAYHKGDYAGARTFALKMNMPGVMNMPGAWLTKATTTAPHGQLGEVEAGRKGVQELLLLMPDFALRGREELSKWYLPDLVDSLMEGLRKAGLEIPRSEAEAKQEGSQPVQTARAEPQLLGPKAHGSRRV
jgi:TolB-like protein